MKKESMSEPPPFSCFHTILSRIDAFRTLVSKKKEGLRVISPLALGSSPISSAFTVPAYFFHFFSEKLDVHASALHDQLLSYLRNGI
jgi:hypothetical protein